MAFVPVEIYSETTYVPQYGLLTESQLRFVVASKDKLALYVGAALQRQDKTISSQDDLYEKNRVMAVVGGRWVIWKNLGLILEARTEERSRGGLYVGDIWQYSAAGLPLFTEFYVESFVLPSFHNDPVSTGWLKQGLRYQLAERFLLDPYLELYARRSPSPDLGRNTDQGRIGLRGIYLRENWSVAAMFYQSYPTDEAPHEEALLVFGGTF
ncbi:hypothetical protein D3C87_125650 [compost metagenome]